jgi:hypothetical protein
VTRLLETIDGLFDADARPAKRAAHRPRSVDAAARDYQIGRFITLSQHRRGGSLKHWVYEAVIRFGVKPTAVYEALSDYRHNLPKEEETYVDHTGAMTSYLRGADGKWRVVRIPAWTGRLS